MAEKEKDNVERAGDRSGEGSTDDAARAGGAEHSEPGAISDEQNALHGAGTILHPTSDEEDAYLTQASGGSVD